jgi:hypothetical protein
MAIPSRGIGWGTEENLLWQISKQIEKLTCVTAGGCGSITTTTTTTLPVYKVYSAFLNQSGTSAPTAVVNENTIGTMTITRYNTGVYYFVSPEFNSYDDYGKVLCFISNGSADGSTGVLSSVNGQYVPPINGIQVVSKIASTLTPTDNAIGGCSIEIRLYN